MDSLNLYIVTFNCARNPIDVLDFANHFFDALPHTDTSNSSTPPDLIVLCLQEIAPIAYSFLGGTFLTPYFLNFAEAVDRAVLSRWGLHYESIVTDNVGMTALMVFARSEVADHISSIDISRVGLGFQEMGNKGAVGARLLFSSPKSPQAVVDLTLVAAHLAPMEHGVMQRNTDWRRIVERLVFDGAEQRDTNESGEASEREALLPTPSSTTPQGIFTPRGYLFIAGDLNYRTSDKSPQKEDPLRFPQANADPDSPRHYTHLLKNDQLTREMQQSQCFHGLSEAPITFPPTYKYTHDAREAACNPARANESRDFGWTNNRWPSWCDRVLFLKSPVSGDEGDVKVLEYDALPVFPSSDHRPVALAASIPILPAPAQGEAIVAAPFSIDPDWERKRDVARKKELVVGSLAYLGWTWEGNTLLVASTIGVVAAWFVFRSLLSA